MIKNVFGKDLDGVELEYSRPENAKVLKNGAVVPNWDEPSDLVDSEGYDKLNVEPNGEYTMVVELPVGTMLARYGSPMERTTAPCGTPYELLALPYRLDTIEYHQYRVIADGVTVKCKARRGRTREMFERLGGAVQYRHDHSIEEEISMGILEEEFSWML